MRNAVLVFALIVASLIHLFFGLPQASAEPRSQRPLTVSESTTTARSAALGAQPAGAALAPNGRAIHYQYWQGQPGKPVYLLFNGLIYQPEWWAPLLSLLSREGASILWYSYSSDPTSLAYPSRPNASAFSLPGVADEAVTLLKQLGLTKVTVLTLSFGSVAAEFAVRYPQLVDRVVMMAPMIVPADHYDPMGQASRAYLQNIRLFWGEAAYEYQWKLTQEPTVRTLVSRRVTELPNYLPQGVTVERAVDGAIEKIKATRDFDLKSYAPHFRVRVDVLLAGAEESLAFADQKAFWSRLPENVRGSLLVVQKAAHALPSSAPEVTAHAIRLSRERIVRGELSPNGQIVNPQVANP